MFQIKILVEEVTFCCFVPYHKQYTIETIINNNIHTHMFKSFSCLEYVNKAMVYGMLFAYIEHKKL